MRPPSDTLPLMAQPSGEPSRLARRQSQGASKLPRPRPARPGPAPSRGGPLVGAAGGGPRGAGPPPIPGRFEAAAPKAGAGGLGLLLLRQVVARVIETGERQPPAPQRRPT